jgi:large subunit ribosomal protein L4
MTRCDEAVVPSSSLFIAERLNQTTMMRPFSAALRRAASRRAGRAGTRWLSTSEKGKEEEKEEAAPAPPPPTPPNLTLSDPWALAAGSHLDEVGASQGALGFSNKEATLRISYHIDADTGREAVLSVDAGAAGPLTPLEIPVESFAPGGGAPGATVALHADVFGAEVRRDLIHRVVVWQRAKRRQGTHKQKNISEVSGSGKKPWAQKGTGRARAGHRRPPHWRGGARAHPKRPKNYAFRLQKRVKNQALRAALSAKVLEGALRVVDAGSIATHKTAPMVEWLAEREVDSALVIDARAVGRGEEGGEGDGDDDDDEGNALLAMACGNIQNVDVILSEGANVYDIVRRKDLILTVGGLEALTERLLTTGKAAQGKKTAVASLEEQHAIREMVAAQLAQGRAKADE